MIKLLRDVALLLWVYGAIGNAQSTAQGDTTTITSTTTGSSTVTVTSIGTSSGYAGPASSHVGNATCPSRTVNYITHTLPRQCLRTDRVPSNSTSVGSPNVTDPSTGFASAYETSSISESLSKPLDGASQAPSSAEAVGDSLPQTVTSTETSTTLAASPTSIENSIGTVVEEESESPLDNANFLSFEEWKKSTLAKTGQSPDDIGRMQPINANRQRPGINNALDTLGEESEIDLDFSGFGGGAQPSVAENSLSSPSPETSIGHHSGNSLKRSKDAGKTCKERTNYASFDCSATVLKSNKECKSASSVLVENKDSYMLNICSAENKFFIVELCNDIQIDTIVLANYEFFSSSFRHFRVSVSDRYPVRMEKWRDLGTFEARNTREIQAFLIENPLIWAKFLRIEFLSQYGTEYYCPVSLLRVHGTTMIEDYRHEEEIAQGEEDEVTLEAEVFVTPAVAQEPIESTDETAKPTVQAIPTVEDTASVPISEGLPPQSPSAASETAASEEKQSTNTNGTSILDGGGGVQQIGVYEPPNVNMTCETPAESPESKTISSVDTLEMPSQTTKAGTDIHATSVSPSNDSLSTSSTSSTVNNEPSTSLAPTSNPTTSPSETSISVISSRAESDSKTSADTSISPNASVSPATNISSSTNTTNVPSAITANSTRIVATPSAGPPSPQPSSQESFFKSFAKRLQQLESNSTLSLQYIEEQSRILRDAFSKVEKRQVSTTANFLSTLNETVMAELHGFRQAYDQLWQSTVIELEGQRDTYQREMFALSSRLTMMADELVWQKQMGIVQSTLLLLCLALVLFGRGGSNGVLEVPIMQQMINRSKRGGWEYSPPNSPSPDSRSPVSIFRKKLWRSKTEPAAENSNLTDSEISRPQSKEGLNVTVEPPSPGPQSDFEDGESSPNMERRELTPVSGATSPAQSPAASPGQSPAASPNAKRSKKRPKKPPNWPQGNGNGNGNGVLDRERVKSPLSL